jgi:Recombination endonuclease VII
MPNQVCTKCGEEKPSNAFYARANVNLTAKKYLSSWCKECVKEVKDPVKARNSHLKRTYGITELEYNEMFNKQEGCCAICKRHQSEFTKALNIDHNHEFNFNRGLLCWNCNTIIGKAHEDVDILQSVIDYLHEWEI